MDMEFEQLIQDALVQDFSGWDFSWLNGRWHESPPSWNYRQLVEDKARHVESLLDMGTGGGEFLASLQNRPPHTAATESYPPNVIVSRQRLEPLGIKVFAFKEGHPLPMLPNSFQLIINRHESYDPSEIHTILQPDGTFLTQQVGPLN
ncbi:MAG: class I SAM-dependent methyltransferase, partial [Chloroflexi bacterium]|nr:class I SAM-dependent methyltransferase [Chloroflexota bacterium]